MTIEELKRLSVPEQKQIYAMFWFEFSAAEPGSRARQKAEGRLDQLKEIFALNNLTWMQWSAEAAIREFAITLALDDFLDQAA